MYGKFTKKQALEFLAAHDESMRRTWVISCIQYAMKWEKLRSPQRWKAMGEWQRKKIIRGWIYKRDFATGKIYAN